MMKHMLIQMKYRLPASLLMASGMWMLTCSGNVASPDGTIRVDGTEEGLSVSILNDGKSQNVMTIKCGPVKKTLEKSSEHVEYNMPTGKRSHCTNSYTEAEYTTPGQTKITMRVYDDGVAWHSPVDETVDVSASINHWTQNWTQSYEDFYPMNRELTEGSHIAFPALFEYDSSIFLLLTESAVGEDAAGASMHSTHLPGNFIISPAGEGERGWTTAMIGSLADVVESTLVTDNSEPSRLTDISWIEPGVASWVYWAYNHGSKDFNIVKRYIDMAVDMKLPYVLIDAEWDEMQGEHDITDALRYATERGIKPMIWYNSSVGWIDGAPGPKFRLNDANLREKEFAWCAEHGVAGVKIDFFSGDNNRNIRYMHDLLESAARHRLLVNFHGVTLPRGWQRTYPNLMSMEGVYGAEWYNNAPVLTGKAAAHNATLPFTRNVVGPMDYTPCAFSDSQHPHITSNAHELALTVLFESGITHLADRPESFQAQPDEVKAFLSELPAAWDNTYLISGYPGDHAVMARTKGNTIYVAGINGRDEDHTVSIDLSRIPDIGSYTHMRLFTDTPSESGQASEWDISDPESAPEKIRMNPRGGFILKLDK